MYVQPITTGIPANTINQVKITISPFSVDATTCSLNYQLISTDNFYVGSGDIILTEEQFTNWGSENTPYLEDIVLNNLGLTRA